LIIAFFGRLIHAFSLSSVFRKTQWSTGIWFPLTKHKKTYRLISDAFCFSLASQKSQLSMLLFFRRQKRKKEYRLVLMDFEKAKNAIPVGANLCRGNRTHVFPTPFCPNLHSLVRFYC
jgi:hypothetical protein